MQKHTKVYMDFFGYDESSFIPCEICTQKSDDIHHIDARGMGGSKNKDDIKNLMALCRKHHMMYGDKRRLIPFLERVHNTFMARFGKKLDTKEKKG